MIWFIPSTPQAIGGPIYDEEYFIFTFYGDGKLQGVTRTNSPPEGLPGWQEVVLRQTDSPDSAAKTNVVLNRNSYWLSDADGFQEDRNDCYRGGIFGRLFLTESNLVFVTESDFAVARPALVLPLASITRVNVDKSIFFRLLVVHTDAGKVHSFRICSGAPEGDGAAMRRACRFIQSKIGADRN